MNTLIFYEFGRAGNVFTSSWKTDNLSTGSSSNNQVKLPLHSTGTYNFIVDWGDGNRDTITAWNQAQTTHTYASIGTYTIKIEGTCTGWFFNNTGDKLKILNITKWGKLRLGNFGSYFYGCSNLTITTVSDVLNMTGTQSMVMAFRDCSSLTTVNRMNEWVMTGVNNLAQCFLSCINFNQLLSNWNVSNVTTFSQTFYNCTNYNQPLPWVTTAALSMNEMFRLATNFNQSLTTFVFTNVTNLSGFMQSKTNLNYSAANYDALLISMSLQTLQAGLTSHFGSIKYTAAAVSARAILTSAPNNWVITDGGL